MSSKRNAKNKSTGKQHNTEKSSAKSDGAPFSCDDPYPYQDKLDKKQYKKTLLQLQIELNKVQKWVVETGQKIVVIFEGRDAAGKGGTIKRFREHLNPRNSRVVALPKPNDAERGQWYFQRYVAHLPTKGEFVFFDRSWYNRAGVEPVMGYCTPTDYQRFIHQAPSFEEAQIDCGTILCKLFFDVGRKEQRRRIESREQDPLKHWKLSPMDYESMQRWDAYTKARDAMFLFTDTQHAPWTIIRSDDKKRARIGAILSVLNRLEYPDKDEQVVTTPDPLIVGSVPRMAPLEGRFMFADEGE